MPSKIESSLTPEQFWDFCARVAQMKGGRKGATLREIQALAAEWDITISENSAKSFRDGAFAEFLEDLKSDKEMAEHIAGAAKVGLGLDDAASKVLEKKLFKTALNLSDNVDPETADLMTKSVERLRTGNRNARRLDSDLQVATKKIEIADKQLALRDEQIGRLQREKSEWEEQRRKIADATAKVRTAVAASPDEIRAKVVAEMDRIMGITK